MENKKMRCHISIIFEECWKTLLLIVFVFITNLDGISELKELVREGGGIILLILLGILLVSLLWRLFYWSRTTILLEEDALIWEKATLNKKTLTINVQNISSINLEQNLLERILNTSRVKIDTNSLSTAAKTDVSLLFKKDTAQEMKKLLEKKMHLSQRETEDGITDENIVEEMTEEKLAVEYTSVVSDIIMHSFYSISLGSVLAIAFVVLWFVGTFFEMFESMKEASGVLGMAGAAFMGICTVGSFGAVLFKRFFVYYDFTAGRKDGKLLLKYGLLKKREYTIPVETINAVKIHQTMIGRICKRYDVSIECIGVGDEDNESAQLTLSLPYNEMKERLGSLLPEYEAELLEQTNPVDKKTVWHKLCSNIYLLILAVAAGIAFKLFVKSEEELWSKAGLVIFAVVFALNQIRIFLNMKTERLGMGEKFVAFTKGSFGRVTTILEYRKLQYLEYRKSPLTKWSGLYKGKVYILSKLSAQESPMVSVHEIEFMKKKSLEL